jgi:hypothetical protein
MLFFLLQAGANPSMVIDTPLFDAVISRGITTSKAHCDAVKRCMELILFTRSPISVQAIQFITTRTGVMDINISSVHHGDSLLHLAIMHDCREAAKLLLSSPCFVGAARKNIYGLTPWEYCSSPAMVRLVEGFIPQGTLQFSAALVSLPNAERETTIQLRGKTGSFSLPQRVVSTLTEGSVVYVEDWTVNSALVDQQYPVIKIAVPTQVAWNALHPSPVPTPESHADDQANCPNENLVTRFQKEFESNNWNVASKATAALHYLSQILNGSERSIADFVLLDDTKRMELAQKVQMKALDASSQYLKIDDSSRTTEFEICIVPMYQCA